MEQPPLRIHLFGPLRVTVRGEPLPRVRTRSVEWLLALLVLRPGRAVSRSWLAGTLWPDSDETRGLKNLRDDLVRLRRALGPEAERLLSPTRDRLTIDVAGADVDVLRFDRGVQAGDERSLREAVALYTGPLMEGCVEEWVIPERDARTEQCLAALEALAARAEGRGELREAIGHLRRAEGMDPLRDSIQRGLMRLLADSGDLPAALETYRVHRIRIHRELNQEPDDETRALFEQLRARAREKAAPGGRLRSEATPHNLPHPMTALIGREEEVREVRGQIRASRLVTLVGGGGVGKTRLAIQVAAERASDLAEEAPERAVFVELASLADPELLAAYVASALGLRQEATPEPGHPLQALIGWLSRHPTLLVLDNCEHLVNDAAALVVALLERAPQLRVLATSRQRLGLNGEVVWRVPSLPAPDPERLSSEQREAVESVSRYPAVQLFVERARMVRPEFRPAGRSDALAVARICRRLDGIPLAIELAAARMSILPVAQIAERLDDRFRLLTGGSRGALPRQQTLQALIDWSYDLLTEEERGLLCRLSVFAGGWTLAAAESVGGSLDLLAGLVEKSLALAEEQGEGVRYRMLETVREYAAEKLRGRGDEDAARNQHLAVLLHLAEESAPPLRGANPEAVLDVLAAELDNFRVAMAWSQAASAPPGASLRLAAALWPLWEIRGHHSEGRGHLRAALARPDLPDASERAELLLGAATLAFRQAELEEAHALARESWERFRTLGDARGVAAALILWGHISLERNHVADAGARLGEGLEQCRQCGWAKGNTLALILLGLVATQERDLPRAQRLMDQALASAEKLGDTFTLALALHYSGYLSVEAGDPGPARPLLESSLELWRRLGHAHMTSLTLRHLGELARQRGDLAWAESAYQEVVAIGREQGNRTHLCIALHELGGNYYEQGNYEAARLVYAESLDLFTQLGMRWGDCIRNNLGSTLFHLGDPLRARELHRETLASYRRAESTEGIAWTLLRLGVVEAALGDAPKAARILAAASVAQELLGTPSARWDQADQEQALASLQARMTSPEFTAAWALGRALTLEQAIDLALS